MNSVDFSMKKKRVSEKWRCFVDMCLLQRTEWIFSAVRIVFDHGAFTEAAHALLHSPVMAAGHWHEHLQSQETVAENPK